MPTNKPIGNRFLFHFALPFARVLSVGCLALAGCRFGATPQYDSETSSNDQPVKVAEYLFSDSDHPAGSTYSRAANLTAGKEVWVGVGMDDGIDWPATTPTSKDVDFHVLPQGRLSIAKGEATVTETNLVTGGYPPSGPDAQDFHSFTHKVPRAYGEMSRCFETSFMEARFVPTESGPHNIEFEHLRSPDQRGFRTYKILVYQSP